MRGRLAGELTKLLHVWDLAADKRVGVITDLHQFPDAVDISPNGHYLLFGDPAAQANPFASGTCATADSAIG